MMHTPPSEIGALRFLVVEDHGFQRWAVERMLRNMGAEDVACAPDGIEALRILRSGAMPADIIVTDLNMPGVDGIELIRLAADAGSNAAFIVVSDQDPALIESVATMTKAYGLSLLDAVRKPLTPQKLAAAVARYRKHAVVRGVAVQHEISRSEVDTALQKGQVEPFFQAILDLPSGAVVAAEALARWNHPSHGLLRPDHFLRLVESNGKLDEMTMLIARKAANACRTWRTAGARTRISINLSLDTLADVTLADRLEDTVRGAGIEPADVIFEVTETAATIHVGRVLESLARLRMKGFGLAIDDFGTGHASMQQLARIPFTELKIDQYFIRHALTSPASRAMIESSLDIARKLGISAVAEGVENLESLSLLREMGCTLVQGHLVGMPKDAAEFEHDLNARARRQ
jgi:EAL domain-containing protein (putative c-di-GMP-specific phosphodiesterase class I)/AmiR/NasT family two-component response regulator